MRLQRHRPSPLAAGILSLPYAELATVLQGSGKAKIVWNHIRQGIDPLTTFNDSMHDDQVLSFKAKCLLVAALNGSQLIPNTILSQTASACGTRKLLLQLPDSLEIETVLIPSVRADRTTVCVSSQVGCDRGCAFCLTATMGFVRNLTSDEIIGQVVRGLQVCAEHGMPAVRNVVFMGMGDAGRNLDAVGQAVACLTDTRLRMSQSKITVSTVGPSPEVFQTIADMPCALTWSLHSPDPSIRRKLVPSSRYHPMELRAGVIQAILSRKSIHTRQLMIAVTLIAGINDRIEDAHSLADFIAPIEEVAPKVVVDLIPYNDVNLRGFQRPSAESVDGFHSTLRSRGVLVMQRVTRGDAESSACGMLATVSTKKNVRANELRAAAAAEEALQDAVT